MLRSLRLALLLWAGAVLAAPAQETASDTLLTVDHYLDWEQVADPQISPDGAQIVYTRRWVNKVDDKWDSALWIMSVDGSQDRKSTRLNSSHPSISYAVFCLKKKIMTQGLILL